MCWWLRIERKMKLNSMCMALSATWFTLSKSFRLFYECYIFIWQFSRWCWVWINRKWRQVDPVGIYGQAGQQLPIWQTATSQYWHSCVSFGQGLCLLHAGHRRSWHGKFNILYIHTLYRVSTSILFSFSISIFSISNFTFYSNCATLIHDLHTRRIRPIGKS